jgi:cytochrome b561
LRDGVSWLLIALIAVHLAAALKHLLVDRDDVFARMLPPRRPRPAGAPGQGA